MSRKLSHFEEAGRHRWLQSTQLLKPGNTDLGIERSRQRAYSTERRRNFWPPDALQSAPAIVGPPRKIRRRIKDDVKMTVFHISERFLQPPSNVRFQPRRLMIAPAAAGCKPC